MADLTTQPSRRILLAAFLAVLILALAASMPKKAEAYTAEQILAPHYNAIALYQRALSALNHQAGRHLYQIDDQINQLVRCLNQGLSWARTRLNEDISRRVKVNDKFKEGYHTLQVEKGKSLVPHYGWLDPNSFKQRYHNENKAIKELRDKIRLGNQSFAVPTIGWITEKALKQRIADKRKERKKIADQQYRGEYNIHFPGLGWVNRKQLKERIKVEEQNIQTTTAKINGGDYSFSLPHLGWVTRKAMLQKIAAVKKQIKDLQKAFNKGTAQLHRPYVGWANRSAVKQREEAQQKAYWALDKQVNAGDYQVHLPTLSWVNRKQVDQRIIGLDNDRKKVGSAQRNQTYSVAVKGFGMLNRKQIFNRLKAANLTNQQKAELNKGLTRVGKAASIDTQIRGAHISQLRKYRNELANAALVQKTGLNNDIKHLKLIIQEEFSRERRYNLMRLKNQLAFLEQSLQLIPSKVPPRPKKKK